MSLLKIALGLRKLAGGVSYLDTNANIKAHPEKFTRHPSPEIRLQVATLVDPKYLTSMMKDSEYSIRQVVAERANPEDLEPLAKDAFPSIRKIVVQRIDPKYLPAMMDDKLSGIRAKVAERIDTKNLVKMLNTDTHPLVTKVVVKRLKALTGSETDYLNLMRRAL